MNNNVIVIENTPYESAQKKLDKYNKQVALEQEQGQSERLLRKLKMDFKYNFLYAFKIVFNHDYTHKTRDKFAKDFSDEERIELEKKMCQHPVYKIRVLCFIATIPLLWASFLGILLLFKEHMGALFSMGFLGFIIASVLSDAIRHDFNSSCDYPYSPYEPFPAHPNFFTENFTKLARHFFLKKKIISIYGMEMIENTIREM